SFFVGFEYLYGKAPERKFFTDFWHIAGFGRHHTGDGGVIFVLKLFVEKPLDLVDLGGTEHIIITVFAFDDLNDLFLLRVLVLDLADDLFENVLDCDESGHASVFVDNDGALNVLALHALEQFLGRLGLGYEEWVANDLADKA